MKIQIGTTYARRIDARTVSYVETWTGADGRARFSRYTLADDASASVAIDASQYAVIRLLEIDEVPAGYSPV